MNLNGLSNPMFQKIRWLNRILYLIFLVCMVPSTYRTGCGYIVKVDNTDLFNLILGESYLYCPSSPGPMSTIRRVMCPDFGSYVCWYLSLLGKLLPFLVQLTSGIGFPVTTAWNWTSVHCWTRVASKFYGDIGIFFKPCWYFGQFTKSFGLVS